MDLPSDSDCSDSDEEAEAESEDEQKNGLDNDQKRRPRRGQTSRQRAASINPVSIQKDIHEAVQNALAGGRRGRGRSLNLLIPTVFRYSCSTNNDNSQDGSEEETLEESHQKPSALRRTSGASNASSGGCSASATTSAKTVYVAGTMNNWRSVEMAALKDESDFVAVIDCAPGKYYYKFCVDGEWTTDDSQPLATAVKPAASNSATSKSRRRRKSSTSEKTLMIANVIKVKAADKEVFEALACDSFAVNKDKLKSPDVFQPTSWGQVKPNQSELKLTTCHPPFLPPQLSVNVLNKEMLRLQTAAASAASKSDSKFSLSVIPPPTDPEVLPEPSSHVMLQHVYAQSIKDHLLVLATTNRYRKKCITIVYYRPIDD